MDEKPNGGGLMLTIYVSTHKQAHLEHSGPDPCHVIVVRKMRQINDEFAHCIYEAKKKEQASFSQPLGSNVSITDTMEP